MLRRSIVQLAYRSSVRRVPLQTTTQIPSYLSSRRAFSVSPKNTPHKPNPGSSVAPESPSHFPKIIAGGLALGSVFFAAYYYGGLDTYIEKQKQSIGEYTKDPTDYKNTETLSKQKEESQGSELSTTITDSGLQKSDVSSSDADVSVSEDSMGTEGGENLQGNDVEVVAPEEVGHVEGRDLPSIPQSRLSSDYLTNKPAEESLDQKSLEVKPDENQEKATETTPTFTLEDKTPAEIETKTVPREQDTSDNILKGDLANKSTSLLDDYDLRDNTEELAAPSSDKRKDVSSTTEDVHAGHLTKDGKLVLDFLEAIHAAEERQADLDASFFSAEMKAMKDKYEKELKDARVREVMYAERETILDKELNRERVKAAAALKSLQEKLEEKLITELEQKEREVEQALKKMQDIAKAELAAAIASEKASQIEKMAEANIHINALCMAFYARSEEARESHSVHKLALGALALEEALSKGLPIKKEIEALHTHVEGLDKNSLIPVVLSTLAEDTQKYGTDTVAQLNHKFDALKGTLRHFSLIPPSGGGMLAHSLAHIASWLKVKEKDQSGDGIESLINRVDSLLAQGKLCEAADTLENGVKGSQAAGVVEDWIKRAKNRAITEQALTVLQSYATSISVT